MSADNGIYIAQFPDGFRVAHAQAIENVNYWPANTIQRKQELKRVFGKSPLLHSRELAEEYAYELENQLDLEILEYGINYIGKYELWDKETKPTHKEFGYFIVEEDSDGELTIIHKSSDRRIEIYQDEFETVHIVTPSTSLTVR